MGWDGKAMMISFARRDLGSFGLMDAVSQRLFNAVRFPWKARKKIYKYMISRLPMSGMTVERVFEIQAKRFGKNWSSRMTASLLEQFRSEMLAGQKFSSVIRPYISEMEYLLISTSEKNGDIVEALKNILLIRGLGAEVLKERKKLYATLLMYLSILGGVVFFLGRSIIPELEKTNGKASVERQLHFTVNLYNFCNNYYLVIVPIFLITLVVIRWTLKNLVGPVRKYLEMVPPWRGYRNHEGFIWLLSFISLVRGGLPEGAALRLQCEYSSCWLRERLEAIYTSLIDNAQLFPRALESTGFDFPSPILIEEIDTFWTGQAEDYDQLLAAAKIWADDARDQAIAFSQVINIICQVVVMTVVGILALETAFLSPETN